MMSFIVIEGDNGTGKDTLAQGLENYGFEIVSYDSKIKEYEQYAKLAAGLEKVNRFLQYGKKCSQEIADRKNENEYANLLLIRYWVSTLAAAYSDQIYDYDEIMRLIDEIYPLYEQPETLIRLVCDYDTRIHRIEQRNSSNFDDKTIKRNKRYLWITEQIKRVVDFNWVDIDTSNLSITQVQECAIKVLKLERRK